MSDFLAAFLARQDVCFLLAMPLLAGLLGGLGNWLGWRVLFGPLPGLRNVWRLGLLGARAEPLTQKMGEALASHISLSELFRLMEPERIAEHVSDSVMPRLNDYVDDIMAEKYAVLWDNLPAALRQRMYSRVRRQLPAMLDNLVDDMAENIDAIVDLPTLLREQLGREPARFTALLENTLQQEKRFLLKAGVAVGFLTGLLALAFYYSLNLPGWSLPCMGLTVAVLSFWVSRRLLFLPVLPARLAGMTWQGRVYRYRPGFATLLSQRLVEQVFSLRSLMQVLLSGPAARRTRAMTKRHMRPLLEAGVVRTTIQLLLGVEGYAHIKQLVVDRAVLATMGSLSDADFSHERTSLIEMACDDHLHEMGPAELHDLLHPLLAESEWVQYMVVMATGVAVGLLQWLWLVLH